MILPTFKESEEQLLIKELQKFLKDQDSPIKLETYLNMCEQLGKDPDPEEMPMSYDQLSYDCQLSFSIFTKLGSRVYGDVGFTGKDYTNLPILIEVHKIIDKSLLLSLLTTIESYYVEKSQKQIKKAHDDMKKKMK